MDNPIKQYDLQDYNHPTYWKFIASSGEDFKKELKLALTHFQKKTPTKTRKDGELAFILPIISFLDVGCGTGNILIQAKTLFPFLNKSKFYKYITVTGIEHDERLGKLAQDARLNTYIMDALKFKYYKNYNIIHYYRPIKDRIMMSELEKKIENEAIVGTVIIARMKMDYDIVKDRRFKEIRTKYNNARIYIKTKE
jgi:SAM-dependent methyltransferase